MPISSLIVRTEKKSTSDVKDQISRLQEASLSETHDDNILVVTETKTQQQGKEIWAQIEQMPGVLKCDLIYHNFEDEEGYPYD